MFRRLVQSSIPTVWGEFQVIAYGKDENDPTPHLALIKEPLLSEDIVLTRIHSECVTGDVFGSMRCDCGPQLDKAMEMIGRSGGLLLYMRQEGRGIGLINKLKAYQLQDQGKDTASANIHLGFRVDERSYEDAVFMLQDLGIHQINLLTNNPEKVKVFDQGNIHLIERIPLEITPGRSNRRYLETKKNIMGHLLDLK